MNYLYIKENNIVAKGNLENLTEGIVNVEVSDEIFNNSEKYIYQNGKITLDSNYEKNYAIKQNQAKIQKIKDELNELDFKTIRALRAGESQKISEYEDRAKKLRTDLESLNGG